MVTMMGTMTIGRIKKRLPKLKLFNTRWKIQNGAQGIELSL